MSAHYKPDTAPHDRFSNRIQLLEMKLDKLDVRIGELMTQRVDAEEALADLYKQRAKVLDVNGLLWCRESARGGVVNGIRNTASDSEYPSSYPVEWQDLDLLAKIMEQSRYHAVSEQAQACVVEINAWILQAKGKLTERMEALSKWDSAADYEGSDS